MDSHCVLDDPRTKSPVSGLLRPFTTSLPASQFWLIFMNFFSSVFGFQFSAVYYDVPKCDCFVFSQLGVQWPSWIWRLMVCISLDKSLANTLRIFFLSYSLLLQVSDYLRVRPFHCISYIFYPLFCCWFFFSFICLCFSWTFSINLSFSH